MLIHHAGFANATRQLRGLTAEVSGTRGASAVAVYSVRTREGYRPLPAAGAVFEGVACVDDAARAAVLYLNAFAERGLDWAREEAIRLVRFVESMQVENGSFANFVLDWTGTKNVTGPTSAPDADRFWTRRALSALACAWLYLQRASSREHFLAGWDGISRDCQFTDQRSLDIITALTAYEASGDPNYLDQAVEWADGLVNRCDGEIIPCVRDGDMTEDHGRLWGRYQEAALALVGRTLGKSHFVEAAEESARAAYGSVVESGFARKTTIPYDVSSVALAAECLYHATHRPEWRLMLERSRSWFCGRNCVRTQLFDPAGGAFFDGLDDDRINRHSGGEANIEGCNAMFGRGDLMSIGARNR